MPHGGELLGASAVAETLDAIAPERLGHGVRSAEDPRVLERVVREGVALEVCPLSNVSLGVYDVAEEVPLRALVDAGATVALGADDPLIFGSRLADQYATARVDHGFSDAELGVAGAGVAGGEPGAVRRRGGGGTGHRGVAGVGATLNGRRAAGAGLSDDPTNAQ